MSITRLNPDTLHKNSAFTQVAVVQESAKMIYVGGQNAVNAACQIVAKDIAGQSIQAVSNVIAALESAGATLADVVKMTIYLVQGYSVQDAFAASQHLFRGTPPPTITVIMVAGLAHPDFLIEIDAIAAV